MSTVFKSVSSKIYSKNLAKENASVSVDKNILNIVDIFRGETPRMKFINDSLKRGLGLFEAVWIFKKELLELSLHKKVIARVGRSSIKPLHKHSGFVEITQESIEFYNKKLDTLIMRVEKKSISEINVGYDKLFKKEFYPYSPPLRFIFNGKTVYLFLRLPGEKKFKGDDKLFIGLISD
ncbi:MAG: hypothetical protein OH338_02440 [Candidatus Parvarchaeota archaeon]|jgi:hypothetical protein|nr:hypothetical protein [Candidatus Parvarchaeota archaeon]MCW1295196.1 hypothetical protein [Candidatus Parvarchaeum tengchongense]MCW1299641.1 hypothetical protein [Candidatus Parvarchaeum tengchongense]MCW1312268.1 hypothetical protein [Candidatus Parvarchaeum tengchongense]